MQAFAVVIFCVEFSRFWPVAALTVLYSVTVHWYSRPNTVICLVYSYILVPVPDR